MPVPTSALGLDVRSRMPAQQEQMVLQMWGAVWAGPTAHYWQLLMHRMLPGKDMRSVLIKVCIPICDNCSQPVA
jgi:hypothetical protein